MSPEDVRRWVAWHRPRRPTRTDRTVTTMLDQAAWLGVTGLGCRGSLRRRRRRQAASASASCPRVDHVLIQADLTAVAPGPLTPDAAHDLGLLADVESRGGATVYRISPESLARAYALGWRCPELLATLQKRSTHVAAAGAGVPRQRPRTPRPCTDRPRRSAAPIGSHSAAPPVGFDDLTPQIGSIAATGRRARRGAAGSRGPPTSISQPRTAPEETRAASRCSTPRRPRCARRWRAARSCGSDTSTRPASAASGWSTPTCSTTDCCGPATPRSDEAFAVAVHRITAAHIIRTAR